MQTHRILGAAIAALSTALAAQIVRPAVPWHLVEASPSWAHLAQSRAEAERLSDAIVLAHVRSVQTGLTLTHAIPETGSADRIPIEIVTLDVERVVRGKPGPVVRLFHTALVAPDAQVDPLRTPAPALATPARPPDAGSQRTTLLEDDPPFAPGERYLLYLAHGPPIEGAPTFAVFAPEGRYLIDRNVLRSETKRGFAPTLDGRRLEEVVAATPRPRHGLAHGIVPAIVGGAIVTGILSKPKGTTSVPSPQSTLNPARP